MQTSLRHLSTQSNPLGYGFTEDSPPQHQRLCRYLADWLEDLWRRDSSPRLWTLNGGTQDKTYLLVYQAIEDLRNSREPWIVEARKELTVYAKKPIDHHSLGRRTHDELIHLLCKPFEGGAWYAAQQWMLKAMLLREHVALDLCTVDFTNAVYLTGFKDAILAKPPGDETLFAFPGGTLRGHNTPQPKREPGQLCPTLRVEIRGALGDRIALAADPQDSTPFAFLEASESLREKRPQDLSDFGDSSFHDLQRLFLDVTHAWTSRARQR